MSTKITIRTPLDVPAAFESMIGFVPVESMAVMSLGPAAPHARLDFDADAASMGAGLIPAVEHYVRSETPAMLLAYSDDPASLDLVTPAWLHAGGAGVKVVGMFRVDTARRVYSHDGLIGTAAGLPDDAPAEIRARRVASSRAELVREVADETNVATLETMARAAYGVGDGARAWVCVDRISELGGTPPADLVESMRRAVDPRV